MQNNFHKISQVKAKFNIYYRYNGNEYSCSDEIDLSQYGMMLLYDSAIDDISQSIKEIRENEKRFQDGMLKELKNIK